MPKKGYFPDAATAIKIAIVVWEPIYGKEIIENEKPYEVLLLNNIRIEAKPNMIVFKK